MSITKEIWRKQWLLAISELTNYDLQRKTWLDLTNFNPHFSFAEFMCYYFDDLLADITFTDYIQMGWISPTEYDILKEWHDKLAAYQSPNNQDSNNEAVLNDPKWQAIVKEGETARLNLLTVLDKEESDALMGRTSVT